MVWLDWGELGIRLMNSLKVTFDSGYQIREFVMPFQPPMRDQVLC